MDTSLTTAHVGYGYKPSLLPIFSIGKITKRKSDQKSVFALKGAVQFLRRDITSRLRNGHVSRPQDSRKDDWRLFDMEPFGKPLPITLTCRHSRTPKSSPARYVWDRDLTVTQ